MEEDKIIFTVEEYKELQKVAASLSYLSAQLESTLSVIQKLSDSVAIKSKIVDNLLVQVSRHQVDANTSM